MIGHDVRFFTEVRNRLLVWGEGNLRWFPWRDTRDPYHILVAEMLLRRTRANQVVPVYLELIRRFPDVWSLADAPVSLLQTLLRPLGLHWRIPQLPLMAREIVSRFGGRVPASREALKALPGVSDYVACAVMVFAFGLPEPIPDANTVRVVGRLLALPVTDGSRRNRLFRECLRLLMQGNNPRLLGYALLDFAAGVCRHRSPECGSCPLSDLCKGGIKRGSEGRDSG